MVLPLGVRRFAIFGSCVTRDAFELPNGAGEVALYLARSSMPVACSPIVPAPASFLTHEWPHEWYRTTYLRFFTKSYLADLAEARPNAVILDLIDDRFDYLDGATILPGIDDFLVALTPDALGSPIDFLSDDGFVVWRDAATRFLAELRRVLPGCPVILHRARGAGEDAYAERNNLLLARKFAAIGEIDPAVVSIEVEPELVVPDDAHQWGRQPFHYVPPYYVAFNDRLAASLGR